MNNQVTNIVLFKNGIETLDYFSAQLAKTFKKLGYKVLIYDLAKPKQEIELLKIFLENHRTVVVSFNFTGFSGEEELMLPDEEQWIWDKYDVTCLNIVVDHPFYYHKLLSWRPRNYIQLSIDWDHMKYMKKYFPQVQLGGFLPLAGTGLKEEPCPYEERQKDIVFTGNYTPPYKFEKYMYVNGEEYAEFYKRIVKELIEHPNMPMADAMEMHIRDEIEDFNEIGLKDCFENMVFIDLYVRNYFRGLVVKTVVDSGYKVNIYGGGWDLLDCKHKENLIIGGPINSEQCLEHMQEAKISLNVMPWFKGGAHDRIFNSMLNGAVCITDGSRYINKNLQNGKELMIYELDHVDRIPAMIEKLLKNPELSKSMMTCAYHKAKTEHTWDCRAYDIDRIIKQL